MPARGSALDIRTVRALHVRESPGLAVQRKAATASHGEPRTSQANLNARAVCFSSSGPSAVRERNICLYWQTHAAAEAAAAQH
jgi:hypothetical protein